ncbi:MAG TPA: hypothetical protein VM715_08910 [Candidatus Acidoferrum sp.]|jgi:hypothetical protein|nr:hypothetical protein [Candidatus Acidoferrum sp.]
MCDSAWAENETFNVEESKKPVIAFLARSSADEWDNIIPYDRSERD